MKAALAVVLTLALVAGVLTWQVLAALYPM
jgi:hypothetical protein